SRDVHRRPLTSTDIQQSAEDSGFLICFRVLRSPGTSASRWPPNQSVVLSEIQSQNDRRCLERENTFAVRLQPGEALMFAQPRRAVDDEGLQDAQTDETQDPVMDRKQGSLDRAVCSTFRVHDS